MHCLSRTVVSLYLSGHFLQASANALTSSSSNQPRPYKIDVSEAFVEETLTKVKNFRPSVDVAAPDWYDGPPSASIASIAKYWTEEYDWFADQTSINGNLSHYITTIPPPGGKYNDSLEIHFVHQRSKREDAIPLLMLHGWPSTSLEWEKVIPSLVSPEDDNTPAFHIVAPDHPGHGFSPAPTTPGFGSAEHSTTYVNLMEQLGYEKYALYSTDLGVPIALSMVAAYEERIINHMSDMLLVIPDEKDQTRFAANLTTPEETAYMLSTTAFFTKHSAYAAVHSIYPSSVAYALNDSPVGFLAWMYHLAYTVSDQAYTPAEIIRQALVLYIPGVLGNIRSYKELYDLSFFAPSKKSPVPTSALQFGYRKPGAYSEIVNFNFVPRDWVERYHNVTYFARHNEGGHFPAESAPELVVKEIRNVFAQ